MFENQTNCLSVLSLHESVYCEDLYTINQKCRDTVTLEEMHLGHRTTM